jgi:hypothetical protein
VSWVGVLKIPRKLQEALPTRVPCEKFPHRATVRQFDLSQWLASRPTGWTWTQGLFAAHYDENERDTTTSHLACATPGSGDGQFNVPIHLTTDASGHVYVTDNGNSRVQKFYCQ